MKTKAEAISDPCPLIPPLKYTRPPKHFCFPPHKACFGRRAEGGQNYTSSLLLFIYRERIPIPISYEYVVCSRSIW